MFWLQYLASIGREDPLMIMNGLTGARTRHFNEIEFLMNDLNDSTDVLNLENESKAEINQLNRNVIIDRDYQFGQISPKTRECFEQGRPELKVGLCRYEGGFVGGCWDRVTGRVVYSNNNFYQRGGNYPREVLYSCNAHRDEDFKDEDLHWCQACERFTRESSFFGEMTCKVCHDEKILQNREIWIPLTDLGIKNFSFNNILSHTLNMADRQNLPSTLKLYGNTSFTLDLTFEDEVGNVDYSAVPIRPFWTANAQRIRLQVHDLKKKLLQAKKEKDTRALLLHNGNEQIQVWADPGLLFEGAHGQDYINLTIHALGEFYGIVGPILINLFVVLLFLRQIEEFNSNSYMPISPIFLPDMPRTSSSNKMEFVYAFIAILGTFLFIFYMIRFREQFVALFRWFTAIDIFFILAAVPGILLMVSSVNLNINTDVFSAGFFAINFGIIGLLPFYKPVGEVVHRVFIVTLFGLVAITVGTVMESAALLFVALFAMTDVYAMLRPRFGAHFIPFILPRNFEVPMTPPIVFYQINGLCLRSTDFLFYGMMASFSTSILVARIIGYIGILFGCVLCLYVLPFFSKKIRPFPVAFAFLLVSLFLTDQILNPYLADNTLKWTLIYP